MTAQFLSVDPEVGATRTPYAYVNDNPINATDPTGNCGWDEVSVHRSPTDGCVYAMGNNICSGHSATTGTGSSGSCARGGDYPASCSGMIIQSHETVRASTWAALGHAAFECAFGGAFTTPADFLQKGIMQAFEKVGLKLASFSGLGFIIGCEIGMFSD